MKFCNQAISKPFTARHIKLDQMIEGNEKITW